MDVNEFIRYRGKIFLIIELLSIALVLANVTYSVAVYDELPEKVPSHFNAQGLPDGWMSKGVDLAVWTGLVLFTFAALFIPNYIFFFRSVQTNYLATTAVPIFTFLLLIRIEIIRFCLEDSEKLRLFSASNIGILVISFLVPHVYLKAVKSIERLDWLGGEKLSVPFLYERWLQILLFPFWLFLISIFPRRIVIYERGIVLENDFHNVILPFSNIKGIEKGSSVHFWAVKAVKLAASVKRVVEVELARDRGYVTFSVRDPDEFVEAAQDAMNEWKERRHIGECEG